ALPPRLSRGEGRGPGDPRRRLRAGLSAAARVAPERPAPPPGPDRPLQADGEAGRAQSEDRLAVTPEHARGLVQERLGVAAAGDGAALIVTVPVERWA